MGAGLAPHRTPVAPPCIGSPAIVPEVTPPSRRPCASRSGRTGRSRLCRWGSALRLVPGSCPSIPLPMAHDQGRGRRRRAGAILRTVRAGPPAQGAARGRCPDGSSKPGSRRRASVGRFDSFAAPSPPRASRPSRAPAAGRGRRGSVSPKDAHDLNWPMSWDSGGWRVRVRMRTRPSCVRPVTSTVRGAVRPEGEQPHEAADERGGAERHDGDAAVVEQLRAELEAARRRVREAWVRYQRDAGNR